MEVYKVTYIYLDRKEVGELTMMVVGNNPQAEAQKQFDHMKMHPGHKYPAIVKIEKV